MDAAIEREESVFYAALEFADPAERRLFLDQKCAGDARLRAGVEELLAAQAEADRFFAAGKAAVLQGDAVSRLAERAGAEELSLTGDLPAEERPGTWIGRYKLLERIGEGGCGVVYMAEQEKPVRRRVALKIIKLGMDTKSVIARFEAERQALALMDHPNIARVLDAGATETGRPFFVMELVRGVKITDFCDQNQMDTDHRLELFIQVCHAIQHAHQKGIIHRDIKPSNILVTLHDGVPVPKVIDFGIAKATESPLTDKTLFTGYNQFLGTPAYMSPEQAEMSGLDADTRSDIYSLGVLLYELLTGRTPFDGKELVRSGLEAMRRTLREKEPQRPSTMVTTFQADELRTTAIQRHAEPPKLIHLLSGDLDWIVMRALEKDRNRRYQTANGLAMDIQRHLKNEAVTARPPSRLYLFQKLVRRNRGIFAGAAAVAVALVLGFGTSTWLLLQERQERRRAVEAEQQQMRLRKEAEIRERITEAAFLVRQDKYFEADQLLRGVALSHPSIEGENVFRALGAWHAIEGRWEQALDRLAEVPKVNHNDASEVVSGDLLPMGPCFVESGDPARYERFRREIVSRYQGTADVVMAERVVKESLLLPADAGLMQLMEPLAALAARSFDGNDASAGGDLFLAAWRCVSLGLMDFRRGRYTQAAEWSQRCLAYEEYNAPRIATARIILAMACFQLHRVEEAHSELTQARQLVEARFDSGLEQGEKLKGFWFDWIFARILLREADGLLGRPAVSEAGAITPGQVSPAR